MNAQPNFEREKVKFNRVKSKVKYRAKAMNTKAAEATSKSEDFIGEMKAKATSLFKKAVKMYSLNRAYKLVKTHPLQAAIGGAALGLAATAHLLGKRK